MLTLRRDGSGGRSGSKVEVRSKFLEANWNAATLEDKVEKKALGT